jgi:hypothetical protein
MKDDLPMRDRTEAIEDQDEGDAWKRIVLCEEDRIARAAGGMRPDAAGFRWFRSPNVIPIELARAAKDKNRQLMAGDAQGD